MRGVFMEKIVRLRKNRIPIYLIIAVVLIAAVVLGIFFLNNGQKKEPSRGTYVIEVREKVFCYR